MSFFPGTTLTNPRGLAPGNLWAIVGDSQVANSLAGTAPQVSYWSRGHMNWLRGLSGQRFRMPQSYMSGVAGETSSATLSRLPGLLAGWAAANALPDICWLQTGGNDYSGGRRPLGGDRQLQGHDRPAAGIRCAAWLYPAVSSRGASTWNTLSNQTSGNRSLIYLREWLIEYAAIAVVRRSQSLTPGRRCPTRPMRSATTVRPTTSATTCTPTAADRSWWRWTTWTW